jgi:hypothetical protein
VCCFGMVLNNRNCVEVEADTPGAVGTGAAGAVESIAQQGYNNRKPSIAQKPGIAD